MLLPDREGSRDFMCLAGTLPAVEHLQGEPDMGHPHRRQCSSEVAGLVWECREAGQEQWPFKETPHVMWSSGQTWSHPAGSTESSRTGSKARFLRHHARRLSPVLRQANTDLCSYMDSIHATNHRLFQAARWVAIEPGSLSVRWRAQLSN